MRAKLKFIIFFLGLALLGIPPAWADTPPTPQFDFIGFIQEAALDTGGLICTPADPLLAGGTITVNGIKMIVPCNTILQMPAATFTFAQLFDPAVSATVPDGTVHQPAGVLGLSLADIPQPNTPFPAPPLRAPFPSFEVRAVGNVVNGEYIVGLIAPITQQGLNGSSGLISYIDINTGFFRVGGIPNDPVCAQNGVLAPACSGALVQFNDPIGRFGLPLSPDQRFGADTNNPTIKATTGYPVCIPRSANDPECPLGNRPLNGDPRFPTDPFLAIGAPLRYFDMPAPAGGVGSQFPDARLQAPLMVGDWIIYSGTLFKLDSLGPNLTANEYISAHTVDANLGIFTAPGIQPAYVGIEEALIGVGGAPVQGIIQEATTRLFVVGFTTDPTRLVDIYAIDVNACSGQEAERLLATTDPATQPVRGRFVHHVLGGFFGAPTREMIIKSRTGQTPNVANGLISGQYRLPIFDFIFPENHRLGDPIIPNNFQDFPFLVNGSGPLFGAGPVVGQLSPWPGIPVPVKVDCAIGGVAPLISAGADIAVGSGALVTLVGTKITDAASIQQSLLWTQTAGPGVSLSNPTTMNPSFTAPFVPVGQPAEILTFQLAFADQFGSASDSVNVTVNAQTDAVTITQARWRSRTARLDVTATCTDPAATLTVEGVKTSDNSVIQVGTMVSAGGGSFTFSRLGVPQLSSVTVRSSGGGSATSIVEFRL